MSGRARALRLLPWLALPTLAAVLLVGLASLWRLPTPVIVELTTRRLAWTLAGEAPRPVLAPSVAFSELSVTDFETFRCRPRRLLHAAPDGRWSALPAVDPFFVRAADPDARITLSGATGEPIGSLDRLSVDPGAPVVLEVTGRRELTLELSNAVTLDLLIHPPFTLELTTDLAEVTGVPVELRGDLSSWQIELAESAPLMALTGRPDGLTLALTLASDVDPTSLFPEQPRWPLAALRLLEQTIDGELRSPLVAPGRLRYPGYPADLAKDLPEREFLSLDPGGDLRLERLAFDPEHQALKLRLAGRAEALRGSEGPFITDHRLSVLDRFRHSSRWSLLAAVAVWALSTAWLVWERWQKLTA